MYVFKGLTAEEPILSSAYICSFSDLEIRAVMLDQLLREPEQPTQEYMVSFEVQALREQLASQAETQRSLSLESERESGRAGSPSAPSRSDRVGIEQLAEALVSPSSPGRGSSDRPSGGSQPRTTCDAGRVARAHCANQRRMGRPSRTPLQRERRADHGRGRGWC